MVVGVLLAGGIGSRMGKDVPKQFLNVNNKPIIFYPLEIMEKHPRIDAVEIVCVDGFVDTMWTMVKEAGFKKVKWITVGGETCQDSTRNGINNLKGKIDSNDIVLIHMASYPLASAEIMSNCIDSAVENGNGCTARPIVYTIFETEDRKTSTKAMERDDFMLCTAPYAFRFGECSELYNLAYKEGKGITGNAYVHSLYCDYGKRIYFTQDSETNIKITSSEDIILMEAYLNAINKSCDNVGL